MALKGTISHFRDVVVVVGVILLPPPPFEKSKSQGRTIEARSETTKYRNENQSQRKDDTRLGWDDGRKGEMDGGAIRKAGRRRGRGAVGRGQVAGLGCLGVGIAYNN